MAKKFIKVYFLHIRVLEPVVSEHTVIFFGDVNFVELVFNVHPYRHCSFTPKAHQNAPDVVGKLRPVQEVVIKTGTFNRCFAIIADTD